MFGVALGPEVRDQLVPAQAALARRGEEGEQGEGPALPGGPCGGNAVYFDRQSAKRPQLQHRMISFDPDLTGFSPRPAKISRVPGRCECRRGREGPASLGRGNSLPANEMEVRGGEGRGLRRQFKRCGCRAHEHGRLHLHPVPSVQRRGRAVRQPRLQLAPLPGLRPALFRPPDRSGRIPGLRPGQGTKSGATCTSYWRGAAWRRCLASPAKPRRYGQ